jgi:hypothetical protein
VTAYGNTAILNEYSNITDFVNVAEKSPSDEGAKGIGKSEDWDFSLGFDGAVNLSRSGWPEGCDQIAEISKKLFDVIKPQTHQQDVEFDYSGSFVDVGRYCDGEPECFGNFIEPENPTKVIRIEIAGAISHSVTAETARNRGAAVVALIDLLESQGYRCELVVVISVKQSEVPKGHTTAITIKNPDQPIDIDALAFSIAHPAFLRRLWFGVAEQEPAKIISRYGFNRGGSYGQPLNVQSDLVDIYIPTADHRTTEFENNESSIEWIKNVIKKHELLKLESETI